MTNAVLSDNTPFGSTQILQQVLYENSSLQPYSTKSRLKEENLTGAYVRDGGTTLASLVAVGVEVGVDLLLQLRLLSSSTHVLLKQRDGAGGR
jgi:hypothetical protein